MLLLLLCAPLPAVAAGLDPTLGELGLQSPEQAGNMLQNPGFEDGFYYWNGINELHLGNDWVPWWIENAEHTPTYFRPEYKQAQAAEFPGRVHGGSSAQQWFKLHSSFYAGIYQQVSGVTPGQPYRFSLWVQVWSSTEDNPPDVSTAPANPHLQIGIDPTGNLDPFSADIIWSHEAAMHEVIDGWSQLAVEANARSTTVTVFVRSRPEFANKHNNIYLDDASLESVIPAPEVTATATASEVMPGETSTDAPPEVPVATAGVQPVTLQPVESATATEVVALTEEPPLLLTPEPPTYTPEPAGPTTLPSSPLPPPTDIPEPVMTEAVVPVEPSPVTEVTAAPDAFPSSTLPAEADGTSTPQGTEVAVVEVSPTTDVATGAPVGETDEESPEVNPICATPLLGVALLVPVLILMRRRRRPLLS